MTKNEQHQHDVLIDLGAVVEETKGASNHDIQDDGQVGANQKFPLGGMLTSD